MTEKLCPECGADVEGLIHHCDCCGALLHPPKTLFHYMVYGTGAFYDITHYLNLLFDTLDQIDPDPYADFLERIEFDFWCFPIEKKAGVSYYASRKKAIVTIELDAEAYIYGTKEEKLALLLREVRETMKILQKRLAKKNIDPDDLFTKIENALRKAEKVVLI